MSDDLDDPDAFDELFACHQGPLLRTYLCVRLTEQGRPEALSDMLAAVYARLLLGRAFLHDGTSSAFHAQLFALIDRALEHLLRPGLERPLPPALAARGQRFVERVEAHWHGLHQTHLDGLLALPEHQRDALLLRDAHRLSMAEIARRLDLPIDTARALVTETRASLA